MGVMAYAMMGGIIVGPVLTLLSLPALYVAWFRIATIRINLTGNVGKSTLPARGNLFL